MTDQDNNSNNYSPIQCQIYDYVEIACMRHYKLDIELITGDIITGKALTTRIKDRQEFIVIELGPEQNSLTENSTLIAETDGLETGALEIERHDPTTKRNHSDTEKNHQLLEMKIRLDLIKSITALDKNAEFGTVAIN